MDDGVDWEEAAYVIAFDEGYGEGFAEVFCYGAFAAACGAGDDPHVTVVLLALQLAGLELVVSIHGGAVHGRVAEGHGWERKGGSGVERKHGEGW